MLSLLNSLPSILNMSTSKAYAWELRHSAAILYVAPRLSSASLLAGYSLCAKSALAVPLLQRTEQTFCYDFQMRGLADIHLDVRGGEIIVDLPGTNYTVTYHKPAVSPQLLAAYQPGKDDPRTSLTQAEFLARAGRLAHQKARELDWIV